MNSEDRRGTGYLDILRWLAIGAVVMMHVASGVVDTIPDQMTASQQDIYKLIKNLMTPGVPIFLMISGALFLDPGKEAGIGRVLKRYLPRILLALFLFGVPYAIMELMMQGGGGLRALLGNFSWRMLLQGFLMTLAGDTWAHMWYLYELTKIYLLMPCIKLVVNYGGKRFLEYMLILGFSFCSLLPFIERLSGFHVGVTYQLSGIYVIYFISGHYLHRYVRLSWKKCAALFVGVESLFLLNSEWGGYNSPIVAAASAALFLLFRDKERAQEGCKRSLVGPLLSAKRNLCFGIYLVHPLFLNIAYKVLDITPLSLGYGGIPVFWAMVFLLSLVLSEAMQRIPLLRKYVV